MNRKKYIGLIALLALSGLSAVAVVGPRREAKAQDTWTGRAQVMATVSTNVSSTTSIVAAVSGKKLTVKAMVLCGDQAGVYLLQDGSGGTTLWAQYLAANTPLVIDEKVLGPGFQTTAGTALYCDGPSSAVLTAGFRIQRE